MDLIDKVIRRKMYPIKKSKSRSKHKREKSGTSQKHLRSSLNTNSMKQLNFLLTPSTDVSIIFITIDNCNMFIFQKAGNAKTESVPNPLSNTSGQTSGSKVQDVIDDVFKDISTKKKLSYEEWLLKKETEQKLKEKLVSDTKVELHNEITRTLEQALTDKRT